MRWLLVLPLFCWLAWAQAEFYQASHDEDKGEVYIGGVEKIDWRQKAHANLPWLKAGKPTAEQFEKLRASLAAEGSDPVGDVNMAEVEYTAPVDALVAKGAYYLISSKGIERLRLVRLNGHVGFGFGEGRKDIEKTIFDGSIIGRTARAKLEDGGLAMFLAVPVASFHRAAAGATLLKKLPENEKVENIRIAFTFQVGARTYLFVKWKGYAEIQRTFCAFEYTLYEVGVRGLTEVSANAYGCDV